MTQLIMKTEQDEKDYGKRIAAFNGQVNLSMFRTLAYSLSVFREYITIDDVRQRADDLGLHYESGNWMGSVFKRGEWECAGYQAANHHGSHGRIIKRWARKRG